MKYSFINYYSKEFQEHCKKPIFKKLDDIDVKILVKFLQRFQVTLENQLSMDRFKSFSNLPIGSLDKDILKLLLNCFKILKQRLKLR
jgi:hypothetical protein